MAELHDKLDKTSAPGWPRRRCQVTRTLCKRKEPGKTESPTEVTGRAEPLEGQEGGGGWDEVRIPESGVVWKEAPESAIQSAEETDEVRVVVLKDSASHAGSQPPAHGAHGDV